MDIDASMKYFLKKVKESFLVQKFANKNKQFDKSSPIEDMPRPTNCPLTQKVTENLAQHEDSGKLCSEPVPNRPICPLNQRNRPF